MVEHSIPLGLRTFSYSRLQMHILTISSSSTIVETKYPQAQKNLPVKFFTYLPKCLRYRDCALPLEVTHQIRYLRFWWNVNAHVYVIRHNDPSTVFTFLARRISQIDDSQCPSYRLNYSESSGRSRRRDLPYWVIPVNRNFFFVRFAGWLYL